MSENMMSVRLPIFPDAEFFRDPDHTIMTRDGRALLSYDPTTKAGFIYSIEAQRWTITAPVCFEVFATVVALSGYAIADTEDAAQWFAVCATEAVAGSTIN